MARIGESQLQTHSERHSETHPETHPETHLEYEEGSITPLISIYFVIVMVLIFIVSNVASTYISRRELINLTESALARATHQLDEMRYYYQVPLPSYLAGTESQMVPIDCRDAADTFSREIAASTDFSEENEQIVANTDFSEESEKIAVLSFECDGRTLRARVQRTHDLPFSLPVLSISQFTNVVDVAVSSRYL